MTLAALVDGIDRHATATAAGFIVHCGARGAAFATLGRQPIQQDTSLEFPDRDIRS
jgi:hypothetical protein